MLSLSGNMNNWIFADLSKSDVSLCMCFRERANLQLVNRRLERKVKEMMMQIEEEQHSMQDQKDQVRNTFSPISICQ